MSTVVRNAPTLKMYIYATLSAITTTDKASVLLVLKISKSKTARFQTRGERHLALA